MVITTSQIPSLKSRDALAGTALRRGIHSKRDGGGEFFSFPAQTCFFLLCLALLLFNSENRLMNSVDSLPDHC